MSRDILLMSVGKVPPEVFIWLEKELPPVFECTCRLGPALPHPDFAWNKQREQFRAEAILARVHAGSAMCVLAVVDLDVYVPDLNFAFGLAQSGTARAIIALPRLRQSFYSLPDNPDLFRERVVKEAIHELGHVFGLTHCEDSRCVMAFSNSLDDTDYKRQMFCKKCKRRLQTELIER